MRREIYHLVAVHSATADELNGAWLQAGLANARAAFLQQLGLTSARLRAEGLRLGLKPAETPVPDDPPIADALGVTVTLCNGENGYSLAETLYDAGSYWCPFWHGVTRVWAETEGQEHALPDEIQRELAAWLHLSRGSVPVPSGNKDASATG